MRRILLVSAVLAATAPAILGARAWAAGSTAAPPSIDDVGPLPCAPGVIRPRTAPAATPVMRASELVEEEEREVRAMRKRTQEFQEAADEAVREAWRRERDAVMARFAVREKPLREKERVERDAAIAEFKAFLARRGDTPEAAEATYRLANLEFEKAADDFTDAHRAWERRTADLTPGTTDDQGPDPEPKADYTEAIATWRTLVKRFDGYGHKDGALYMIAFCLGEMGDTKSARDTFEELAKTVPDSHWAAEAWVRVGEYHFDRGEFWPAIDAYGHATAFHDSPFYDKALYKLAWSWYRLADRKHPEAWENSARTFARLLDAAPSSPLRAEALQYLALIYADHGGLKAVEQAADGKPWSGEVFPALAEVWYEEGSWDDASQAFAAALQLRPDADAAPAWMHRRAVCARRLHHDADAARLDEQLHYRYGVGSDWAAAHASHPGVVASASALAEPALLRAAIYAHQHAQDTLAEGDYARAADLYGEYLKRYPGRPTAYDISFYRAECLYYARRFAEAADAYGDVLQFTTDDRWHVEAAFSMFKARERVLGEVPSNAEDPPPDAATHAMEPAARAYADAAEEFVCVAPTDWRLPELLFRASQVYYAARRLPAARARAEAVVTAVPKEDFGAFAATLIVDAWRLEGNWAEVEAAATKYAAADLGRSAAVRESTRTSLARVALEAGFRVAEGMAAKGDYAAAAEKFLAIADANPRSDIAPRALFLAGDALDHVGADRRAGEVFGRLTKGYPASPLVPAATFRHARAHEKVLLLGQASKAYADYLKKFPTGADAKAATWNVAVLLDAAAKDAEAAAAWERYAARYPGAEDVLEARMRAAESWTRAGKDSRAVKAWRALAHDTSFDASSNVVALAGLARAERDANLAWDADARRALESQALLQARGGSTAESARAAARIGLAKAAVIRRSFDDVRIALPESRLKSALRVKRDLLTQLENTLLSVAAAGDADASTEALWRIGDAYAAQARAMREAPVPHLDPHDVPFWKERMNAAAEPLEEKAAAAWNREIELATKAGVETEWTIRSRFALAALDPSRARVAHEDVIPMPEPAIWVWPELAAPPGTHLADAGTATPSISARAAAVALAVDAFRAARAKGTRADALAAAAKIEQEAAGVPRDAGELRGTAFLDAGLARAAVGDLTPAGRDLEQALEASPDEGRAAAAYVAVLGSRGDADTAISAANDWLSKHGADAAVRANLAAAELLRGKTALALDTASDALGFDASLWPARRTAIESAFALRRPELAIFIARQAVELFPGSGAAAEALGETLRRSGDERIYGRAAGRESLAAAAARFPDDSRLGHAAGAALLQDGAVSKALPLLERAAPREMTADAWIALAAARRLSGDPGLAVQACDEALALSPDDPRALRNRGLASFDAGDCDGAAASFRRYLSKTEGTRPKDDPVSHWLDEALDARKKGVAPP